jgi:hypothetical protein
MPRRKFTTDEERVQAIRDYHRKYYESHREVITTQSRQWRKDHKPAAPPVQPVVANPVA